MAEMISVECQQCDGVDVFTQAEFFDFVRQAENTRINLEDSGSLNLSLYICDACLGD